MRFGRGCFGSLPGQYDGHLWDLGTFWLLDRLAGLWSRIPGQVRIANRYPIARLDGNGSIRLNRGPVDQDLAGTTQIGKVQLSLHPTKMGRVTARRHPRLIQFASAGTWLAATNNKETGRLHLSDLLAFRFSQTRMDAPQNSLS